MSKFKYIDLFCGIGGFHQAMQRLDGKCVFACDINVACREVYKNNFCPNGEFPLEGDIKKSIKEGTIPEFDVLCGGFPCQTFSKAGKRTGFGTGQDENGNDTIIDDRGQLFYRIVDILKEHSECKYVILENVRNLADNEENWKVVCNELKELDFVITEKPIIESPHNFGIPQVRDRVYILGVKRDFIDGRRKRSMKEGYITRDLLGIDSHLVNCRDNSIDTILDEVVDEKYYLSEDLCSLLDAWQEFKDGVDQMYTPIWLHKMGIGIKTREEYISDEKIGYEDMPKWKQALVMKSRKTYENNMEFIDKWVKRHDMLSKSLLHQKFEWNVGTDCDSIKEGIIQIRQSGIRLKRPNYYPSLVAMSNTPIIWDKRIEKYRYITPKEAARLQSFDDDYQFSDSDSITYRQLGNSVNVQLIEWFAEGLFKLGMSFNSAEYNRKLRREAKYGKED
ncbi:MAG: DNA (cytosine-5-)-methyltransferase [Clostridia bacterium]|nr:DNA (cytosine-5-)-methyltransferase [Clostridia bacterium]